MQTDHSALGSSFAASMQRKVWKLSEARGLFQKSCAFLDLCSSSEAYYLFTFSVMFDAMPGIFDGGHLSSSGGFSFADFFSIDLFVCERWPFR